MICDKCGSHMKNSGRYYVSPDVWKVYFNCRCGNTATEIDKPSLTDTQNEYFIKPDLWWEKDDELLNILLVDSMEDNDVDTLDYNDTVPNNVDNTGRKLVETNERADHIKWGDE